MDKACAEFEGYNDEIKTQLEEGDPEIVELIGAYDRLIANSYGDEFEGTSQRNIDLKI